MKKRGGKAQENDLLHKDFSFKPVLYVAKGLADAVFPSGDRKLEKERKELEALEKRIEVLKLRAKKKRLLERLEEMKEKGEMV